MKEKGIARSGLQAWLVIGLLAALAGLFALVLAFGGGFVMGTAVERSAAPERCADAGGTWMPDAWLCEKVPLLPGVDPLSAGDVPVAYACGNGARFTLAGIGTASLTLVEGGETRVLPRDEAREDRYQDDAVAVTVSGDEADYVDREAGISTFCLRSDG